MLSIAVVTPKCMGRILKLDAAISERGLAHGRECRLTLWTEVPCGLEAVLADLCGVEPDIWVGWCERQWAGATDVVRLV